MRGKKIFDEFTDIKCGKRRYVLRNVARGLCPSCGKFVIKGYRFCQRHHESNLKNIAKYRDDRVAGLLTRKQQKAALQILDSLGK